MPMAVLSTPACLSHAVIVWLSNMNGSPHENPSANAAAILGWP
jgi:hypothetical protein